ncbi:hypothetical protein F2P56_002559 [Juglans regia]|uniref:Reverse transcriptase domain-containing protein n=1 Tax=Juglans regia TaxID=51240 RepID=A0A833YGE4_JUGRE|nr:hypothetical protein F2P56_002559 [Juglans regia]
MPGIGKEIIEHKLSINSKVRPVKQKKRNFSTEKYEAIAEEVDRLLTVRFIREAQYPNWLSNIVLVNKSNRKWRMCVDFTDLNKACQKDSFPLLRTDFIIDVTAGHKMFSFMDAYSRYKKIRMNKADQEKTDFITDLGLYCYKVMPFVLKNTGATYQRLVNKMFKDQIGRNMKVYVDDLLVKSLEFAQHIEDLEEAFQVLQRYQIKLNPTKCAFGVQLESLLDLWYQKEEFKQILRNSEQ